MNVPLAIAVLRRTGLLPAIRSARAVSINTQASVS